MGPPVTSPSLTSLPNVRSPSGSEFERPGYGGEGSSRSSQDLLIGSLLQFRGGLRKDSGGGPDFHGDRLHLRLEGFEHLLKNGVVAHPMNQTMEIKIRA